MKYFGYRKISPSQERFCVGVVALLIAAIVVVLLVDSRFRYQTVEVEVLSNSNKPVEGATVGVTYAVIFDLFSPKRGKTGVTGPDGKATIKLATNYREFWIYARDRFEGKTVRATTETFSIQNPVEDKPILKLTYEPQFGGER